MAKFNEDYYAEIKILAVDHPDLNIFQNKAGQDVLFTSFAYDKNQNDEQKLANDIPNNYQLVILSDHLEDTNAHEYRCAAFVDYENKEIVFATAGTRPWEPKKFLHDIIDDAMLAIEEKPLKASQSLILNDIILHSLGREAENFTFHYTGHSLGAAMAEISAVDMDIKLQKLGIRDKTKQTQISAITFETPGTLKILEKMYRAENLSAQENIKDLNLKEFNNRDNIINASSKQSGQVYNVIPSNQDERISNPLQKIAAYLAKYAFENSRTVLGRLVGKILLILAPGGLNTSLVQEHGIKNFNNVLVQKKGIVREKDGPVIVIDDALKEIQTLEYDEQIYNAIEALKAKNKNIGKQEYSMHLTEPSTGEVKKILFSKLELEQASRQQINPTSRSDIQSIKTKGTKIIADQRGDIQNKDLFTSYKEVLGSSQLHKS